MRTRSALPVLVAFSAGLTAAAALRRFVGRRRVPAVPTVPAASLPAPVVLREAVGVEAVRAAVGEAGREGTVLPFTRPAAQPARSAQPIAPGRCGDSGGRTRAGAPCAARATSAGRCHHHRAAA